MKRNRIKDMVRQGRVPVGIWCDIADRHFVEMMGIVGYDFVVLEYEHSARTLSELEVLIYAADAAGVTSVVRLRANSVELTTRILAAGAMGIILAQCQNAEQARVLVEGGKYPPLGHRGAHPTIRALEYCADFGSKFGALARQADDDVFLCPIIEDKEGASKVDEIAAVNGIDALMWGPVDLALDMGLIDTAWGQDPQMVSMRDKLYSACHSRNKWVFDNVFNIPDTPVILKRGPDILVYTHDITHIRTKFENDLKTIRQSTDKVK